MVSLLTTWPWSFGGDSAVFRNRGNSLLVVASMAVGRVGGNYRIIIVPTSQQPWEYSGNICNQPANQRSGQ